MKQTRIGSLNRYVAMNEEDWGFVEGEDQGLDYLG